jgi:hypothetical protein
MHTNKAWLMDVKTAWVVLSIWAAVVFLYGLWRSRGSAAQDPIRKSGPIL